MRCQKSVIRYVLLFCGTLLAAPVNAAERYLGVADCAGSTCHAATQGFADRPIDQNEYFIWQRQDRHAQSWNTLLSDRSRAITAKLGGSAPERTAECLACHAHAPAQAQRGPRFQVQDGIGCEACHGPSGGWIAQHVDQLKTPREKSAAGMTPTWDVPRRAQLCTGCHLGDAEHPITHAMMAAGHPPLLFELDTFTALMPPHWTVDADYVRRKSASDPALNWLAGQVAAADAYLSRLESGALHQGLFPELALFDCDACHHSLEAGRWQIGRTPDRAPGEIPLADQPLQLLQASLQVLAPSQATQFKFERARLYQQYPNQSAALREQARQMRRWLHMHAAPRLRTTPDAAQTRSILRGVIGLGLTAHSGDFQFAQQTAMAAQVLHAALAARSATPPALQAAIDALYQAVRDRKLFSPPDYRQALERVHAAI